MKIKFVLPLLLLSGLAGAAHADSAIKTSAVGGCDVVGPVANATAECKAVRVAFLAEVSACMDRLRAEAAAGQASSNNSHTSRARFLACDSATRAKMGQM